MLYDFQQRYDTAANWAENNIILRSGVLGFESDTGEFKIGDGNMAWNDLKYAALAQNRIPNASGSVLTTTGSISGGAKTLTLASHIDFVNGQGITLYHAGNPCALSAPAAPTLTVVGTAGTTAYQYWIAAIDGHGGVTASATQTISTGNETLSSDNKVTVSWATVTGAAAYAVWGRLSNSKTLLAVTANTSWDDVGGYNVNFDSIPQTPTSAALGDTFVSQIAQGGGTTILTLRDAAVSSIASQLVQHEDTEALQAAIDALPQGGSLHIALGTYYVSSLNLSHNPRIHIEGDGIGSCLKEREYANGTMLEVAWCDRGVLDNFQMDGSKDRNTAGHGCIITNNSSYFCFQEMEIHDFAQDGIRVIGGPDPSDPDTYLYTDEVHIDQSFVYANGHDGLYLDGVGGLIISNNEFEYNLGNGIETGMSSGSGSNGHMIIGCNILSNKNSGIYLYQSSRLTILGNTYVYNGKEGVYVEGGGQNFILNNGFELNGQADGSSAIKAAYTSDVFIEGNIITNADFTPSQLYGIELYSAGTAYIVGNSVTDHPGGGSLYVSDSKYVAIGNQGIDDSIPFASDVIYPATVSDTAIAATVANYAAGKVFKLSLSAAVSAASTLTINGGTAYSLVGKDGSAVTALAAGAVIQIYQATDTANFQVL